MNDHLSFEELSALVDDMLPEPSREHARAHLATCAPCRAEHEAIEETARVLRATPLRPLPDGVDLRVPIAVLEATPQEPGGRPTSSGQAWDSSAQGASSHRPAKLRWPRFPLLATGALAAAVVLAVGLRLGMAPLGDTAQDAFVASDQVHLAADSAPAEAESAAPSFAARDAASELSMSADDGAAEAEMAEEADEAEAPEAPEAALWASDADDADERLDSESSAQGIRGAAADEAAPADAAAVVDQAAVPVDEAEPAAAAVAESPSDGASDPGALEAPQAQTPATGGGMPGGTPLLVLLALSIGLIAFLFLRRG